MKEDKGKKKRNYTLSIRNTDSEKFIEFVENQSNLNEALRVLIYKQISENGTEDISKEIYARYMR